MSYIFNFPLTIFFAILPSFLWLNFYLREDEKPEPKLMILKVFLLGMIFALPTIYIEIFLANIFESLALPSIIHVFLGVALIEELMKFFVVAFFIFNSPELEEPIDTMIYMIIAGLGFAAAENILFLYRLSEGTVEEMAKISFLRFVSATFLHALSCAIVGIFIGLSFFRKKERKKLIFLGIILATILHGLYNFFIMGLEKVNIGWGIPAAFTLLLISALFVIFGFKRLKE